MQNSEQVESCYSSPEKMRCEHHNEAGKLKSIDRFGIAEMVSPEISASELRYSYEDDQTEVVFIVNGVLEGVCDRERERA